MRILRYSWLAGLVVAGACDHDELVNLIDNGGSTAIPAIDMTTAAAGGFLGGTRSINQFLYFSFDTAVVDAFGRSTTNPPYFRADPNPFYGTTSLVYAPNAAVTTFTPPVRLLPALTDTARIVSFYGSGPNAIGYIVPGNHPGNGSAPVWEFWFDWDQLAPNTRYVLGLARYQLQVNGALDWAEQLQTGTITQPDTLVFPTGNTAGGKKTDGVYTTNCASANIIQPIAGANPHLVGGGTTDATGAVEIDQTVCSNASSAWFNGLGDARSPVPKNNNTPPGTNQYNFLVLWEALADSTPNYAKPVMRLQIGPLVTTAGFVHNNTYGPFPTTQLTQAQLAAAPGGQAVADSLRVNATTLFTTTATAVYSTWLVATSTGATAKVTGNVIRSAAGAVMDTLFGVSEFALSGTMDGASVRLRIGDYAAEPWNAAVLAVGAPGATSLPASQPLWTAAIQKVPGSAAPPASASLVFGAFNGGAGPQAFGANGSGTGGIFGTELREDIKRMARPPVGFFYDVWLANSTNPALIYNVGPLLAPYPDLSQLTGADTLSTAPMSGVELTQAAVRFIGPNAAFFCDYDRVQVRLRPKDGGSTVPPTLVLQGSNPRTGC